MANAFSQAPELWTPRLVLRGHTRADYDDCVTLWTDPAVTRFIGGRPSTPEEVWARLLRYAGHWAVVRYGYWVVRERETGRFVGEAGLADFRRDLTPPLGDTPEAGWVVSPSMHGRGYATEAMQAVLAWSDRHLGPRSVCMIDPRNEPSLRVAARCGYVETGRTTYKGEPSVLFERLAPGSPG